tara:strand:+ start:338 stop:619 length:282 start_codon:yes stop_codon:yes gene_type:complete
MKYILTITLALFVSVNVFADDEEYLKYNKEIAEKVKVAKIILGDGDDGYILSSNLIITGALEAKAGNICKRKGYIILREETRNDFRKLIIKCN